MIDVALVGGGPAGLALAGMLAVRGRRVVVFERTTYAETRVGETFGAEIGARLDDIGAAQAMADLLGAQVPFALVRSTWGSDEPAERPSIMHPLGTGWHVDRARFDERLAEWAASVGADVRRSAGKCSLVRSDDGVSVRSANGDVIATRLAVDASGRGALASTGIGERHWCAADRQVAIMTRMTVPAGHTLGPELLLEAVDIGFWYSAPLPDGTLVIVLVTDADLLVGLGRDRRERLVRALAASTHTRVRADGFALAERPRVVRSDSGWLVPDRGAGWCAIGDAAMATDPLRGHGVARALRSAIVTASEIDDADVPGDPAEGIARTGARFAEYLDERASYYLAEPRWPDAPFWARRRPRLDWHAEPITLDPVAPLRWRATSTPHAEAMLPFRCLDEVQHLTSAAPTPAHVVLAALRRLAPMPDHKLLVGLQYLIESGTLDAG